MSDFHLPGTQLECAYPSAAYWKMRMVAEKMPLRALYSAMWWQEASSEDAAEGRRRAQGARIDAVWNFDAADKALRRRGKRGLLMA